MASANNATTCCELASRMAAAPRPGVECLLNVALSEEFSKYYTIRFCSVSSARSTVESIKHSLLINVV